MSQGSFPPTGLATNQLLAWDTPAYLQPTKLPWLIWEFIDNCWPESAITFTDNHPLEEVTHPTVVWSINHRVPGPPGGVAERKPRYRGAENRDDALLEHFGQKMSITYQFDVYDRTSTLANQLMERFEDYLFNITPLLHDIGVDQFTFIEQVNDKQLSTTERVAVRSLRYLALFDKRYAREIPKISIIRMYIRHDLTEELNETHVRSGTADHEELVNTWVYHVRRIVDAKGNLDPDYAEGVDYEVGINPITHGSAIRWLRTGKKPATGASYYVTYLYFSHYTVDEAV